MLSKKFIGIAGAAMLGTVALLGTNAANAAIDLDAEEADDRTATFAQETVTAATDDDMMYYMVSDTADNDDSEVLEVMAEIGLGAAQDESLTITFNLTDMKFGADIVSASLTLMGARNGGAVEDQLRVAGERVLTSGGMEDDSEAVFRISNGDGTIEQTDVLTLDIDTLGVMVSGGTISVTVRHEDTSLNPESPDNMGTVNFASGIMYNNNGVNAMTYVADNYMNFGPEGGAMPNADPPMPADLSAHVGSFSISVDHLNAAGGTATTLASIFGDAALNDGARDAALMEASITFAEMMFGFADDAWLQESSTCAENFTAATNPTQVWDGDAADDDDKLKVVGLVDLGGGGAAMMTGSRYLCIAVDGETSIPNTDYYTAETMFEGIEDAKMPPMDGMVMLGKIKRDGITVQLPYLTTSDKYNQRLVIVNRNTNDVAYTIEFSPEAGRMVTPMAAADDEVAGTNPDGMNEDPPNGVTTMIKVSDIVDIDGMPQRTAGTLMLESVPGMVDVATTQVNIATGGTDTVVYQSEEERDR